MRPSEIKAKAEEMGISFASAVRMRIRYLLEQVEKWEQYIDEQTDVIPPGTLIGHFDELCRLKEYEHRLQAGTLSKNSVTDDMVEIARSYPIEKLVELDRTGSMLCLVHQEKTPSMKLDKKRQRLHCFGCGADIDAIGLTQHLNGMSFIDAVKSLQ